MKKIFLLSPLGLMLLVSPACKDKKKNTNASMGANTDSTQNDTLKQVVESPFNRPQFDPKNPNAPATINAGEMGFVFQGKKVQERMRQFPVMHPLEKPDPVNHYSHMIEGVFYLDPPPSNGNKPSGPPQTLRLILGVEPGKTGKVLAAMAEYNKDGVKYIIALGQSTLTATRFEKQGVDYVADFSGTIYVFNTSLKPAKSQLPQPIALNNFTMKNVVIKTDNKPFRPQDMAPQSQTSSQPGVIRQTRP